MCTISYVGKISKHSAWPTVQLEGIRRKEVMFSNNYSRYISTFEYFLGLEKPELTIYLNRKYYLPRIFLNS